LQSLVPVLVLSVLTAQPSLETVLSRVEQYVDAYEAQLTRCVARESYVQHVTSTRLPHDQVQTLTSDFLFVRLPGDDGPWLGIRDVQEVDGMAVADKEGRLREIAMASPEDARIRAVAMAQENARYNIGGFTRTINVPTGVLGWVGTRLRHRFRFTYSGSETLNGVEAWRIDFTERGRPTVVKTPLGKDVVSTGRIWVSPDDGRVLQTQLHNKAGALDATILVRFAMDRGLGILVPVSMHERYVLPQSTLETEGTYSNFRKFDVTTHIK
jgi:hypothetical protein